MAKFVFCCLFIANSLLAAAQQNRFIYIQTENKQPFYVKLDKKLYSSAASGYVIIPQLTDGSYNLEVGFPKKEWPEQRIFCKLDKKDAGFLLKDFGDKGWGLFNLQTLEVLMAGNTGTQQATAVETKKDEFSNLLSNAVNDSTIRQAPVAKPLVPPTEPKPQPVEPQPTAQPQPAAKPPVQITQLLYLNGKEGAEMIYTDQNGGKTDTIRILIPTGKENGQEKPGKAPQPLAGNEGKGDEAPVTAPVQQAQPPAVKEEKPVVKEAQPLPKEAQPPVKVEKPAPKEQFINMELPNPAGKQPDAPVAKETPKEQPAAKLVAMVNSNCRSHANEDDFMKLRKKMAAADNEDDMVAVARKVFKTKCFTTEQVKNLGVLFLKDGGRYQFFDAAYPYVSDTDSFASLESQLSDPYQINRFRAMIKK
jgi:hypothetical protein